MNSELHPQDPTTWAQLHFADLNLNDTRRNTRAITIAQAFAQHPELSVPQAFTRKYDVKAAYAFFDMDTSTPTNLQATHKKLVSEAINQPGTYLLLEDGSEFNWSNQIPRTGLGLMHKGFQGFILQSVLAVEWFSPKVGQTLRNPVRIIGLAHQEYYARVSRPENETNQDTNARKKRVRESQLWTRSGETLGNAPAQEDVRQVRVADRGADIEFFIRDCVTRGYGFVVRAAQNRCLVDENNQALPVKLFEVARAQEKLGMFTLELRARAGVAARSVELSVSCTKVRLRSTSQPGRSAGKQSPIDCSVVRVWESNPLKGVKALEWILLCDTNPNSFDEALEVALQYAARWVIEEFHKCVKTGLGADDLQLETANRLFAAISMMSVVALRLLNLKEMVRFDPMAKAIKSGLSKLELSVLSAYLERKLKTVADVALAIGRLGGHMNRRSDGMPGWQSLWVGMRRLEGLVDGVRLAKKIRTYGV